MKKGKNFFIVEYNPAENKVVAKVVKGRISDDGIYGFHYIKQPKMSRWVCTDLKSGLLVTQKQSLPECEQYLVMYADKIEEIKRSRKYSFNVECFERCVKEYLQEQDAEMNSGW